MTVQDDDEVATALTLPDDEDKSEYILFSDSQPLYLKVNSTLKDSSSIVNIDRCEVKLNGEIAVDTAGVTASNVGATVTIKVYEGDDIAISAPQAVYVLRDDSEVLSSDNSNMIHDNAVKRYYATGIGEDGSLVLGDPTFYRFTVNPDDFLNDEKSVTVNWREDFALRIRSDFSGTKSQLELSPGQPWAGPLTSQAAGDPLPSAMLHWIAKGDTVAPEIDGEMLDFTHPTLSIRHVPVGYDMRINDGLVNMPFTVGQSPGRQRVDEFTMTSEVELTYIWQIQYGIQINPDDAGRTSLPMVQILDDDFAVSQLYKGEGTYWFDPGTKVRVLCAANDSDGQALDGWVSGDGYYFESLGEINSIDGTLFESDYVGSECTWRTNVTCEGKSYRGIEIRAGLQRPVKTLWTYGNQAMACTVPIGKYVFETGTEKSHDYTSADFQSEPSAIEKITVSGENTQVNDNEMAAWDAASAKLYPVVPGIFRVTWSSPVNPDNSVDVLVTAIWPETSHYPHVVDTPPVNLDPVDDDNFIYHSIKYSENAAAIDGNNGFTAASSGKTVLEFGEIVDCGRGGMKEYLQIRVVESKEWTDVFKGSVDAVIGQHIQDELDLAKIGTGYLINSNARYNPFVYDISKLDGLSANSVYDMALLESPEGLRVVEHPENLPGPIIPVNLHPGVEENEKITIVWYDNPAMNEGLVWPHAARSYNPCWPANEAEGLRRIVIASQFGSDCLGADRQEQSVVPEIGNAEEEFSYDPSRIQQPVIYNQPDVDAAVYNPNEEHALMVPSLRYADHSPRPPAVYALRFNDLNVYEDTSLTVAAQPADYTSHPFVLVQFYDVADSQFKMLVYRVEKEDSGIGGYSFADSSLWANSRTPTVNELNSETHVNMIAGEPVIPFYPLGDACGAVIPPENKGMDILSQLTYWEDHKGSSWAVSGGENAWFGVKPYYPLLPDFWWPVGMCGRLEPFMKETTIVNRYPVDFWTGVRSGRIFDWFWSGFMFWPDYVVEETVESLSYKAAIPAVGDNLAFLPDDVSEFSSVDEGEDVGDNDSLLLGSEPTQILYKGKWPDVAPTLKAGETLTFAGGEYRADKPTSLTSDSDGNIVSVETPGLPGVLAFASAEIVFDSLNPDGNGDRWGTDWTARVGQVLEKRAVDFSSEYFPGELAPATGRTRMSEGKYIFTELPASLQKRFRYDPQSEKMEISGLLNDKGIGDSTLTASPPAVYVLEPNILTAKDVASLKGLSTSSRWDDAIDDLLEVTKNPCDVSSSEDYLVGLDNISGLTVPLRALGPGLALIPNADFLDPDKNVPDVSWVTVVENNDSSLGSAPITPHIIKVDRRMRYRGAIKSVLAENVFDENVMLRHQGDFGANADNLVFEWWYRPDD